MSTMQLAANERQFAPTVLDCPEFARWAHRIALRLANLPPDAPDQDARCAILSEGTPSPEWASALAFMLTMARDSRTQSLQ